ncbi:EH domain-containing protein 1 [Labeo rohita]|uniref:EH domain-containing protein 1 n=1 Tax=Labeo rohita TaxID=84645 RepID=A0ABQ8MQ26_LABRO|nr:EH domain-containing protein 1 [Labeo rohita]
MSGCKKPRAVANPLESTITTPSERILKECHDLYIDNDNGLVKIAESLGVRLLPPRKKIIVMIMGNHSAGKSSFINWYVEEHIQKTGVAIETQGFTFITSGRKRESLTGNATLHLYPHFRPLLEFKGVTDYLSAEISTSKQKKFSLVTFVDTPGLVDGDMVYPFDVNCAITSFGEQADLIFVFFDPMGQALCKRTLNIVEKLSEKCGDKLRFYLSKADEAGRETDRQRVMMQIVQELCRRPGLNKCGFEMPTIYIPNPQKGVVVYLWDWIPEDWQIMFVIIFSTACYFMFFLAKYFARQGSKTLTKREKKKLAEYSDYIQDVVKSKKNLSHMTETSNP